MSPARLARALATPAVVALATTGCVATPDAADLVVEQRSSGPVVSEADAAAALLDYIGVVNDALASGDTDELAAMTSPECPCQQLVGLIEERYADGAQLEGAAFDADEVSVLERRRSRAEVQVRVSVSAYQLRNGDGLLVGRRPAEEFVATYTLQVVDDQWRVLDVRRPTQGSG